MQSMGGRALLGEGQTPRTVSQNWNYASDSSEGMRLTPTRRLSECEA